MSAAHKLVPQEQIQIGGTTAAPALRPAHRPAPKRQFKPGNILAIGSVWMVFMVLCFSLVQKNAAIRSEVADIARMNAEMAQLGQSNLALEGETANRVSVGEVERWAKAHNMKPPSGVVQTLQGKEEAVAVRHSPAPATVEAAQGSKSFWQALLARISFSSSQAAGAKQ